MIPFLVDSSSFRGWHFWARLCCMAEHGYEVVGSCFACIFSSYMLTTSMKSIDNKQGIHVQQNRTHHQHWKLNTDRGVQYQPRSQWKKRNTIIYLEVLLKEDITKKKQPGNGAIKWTKPITVNDHHLRLDFRIKVFNACVSSTRATTFVVA